MNNNNDLAAVLGVIACVVVVALPIGLAIGSAILRAAIALANKVLGRPADAYDDRADDYDDYDDDDQPRRRRARRSASAVPEPSFLKGMGVVFVISIVNVVVNLPIGFVVGAGLAGQMNVQMIQLVAQAVSLPVDFLIMAGLLTPLLPTTFGRACLVTLFYYLIAIAICVVIFGALFGVMMAAGGGFGR